MSKRNQAHLFLVISLAALLLASMAMTGCKNEQKEAAAHLRAGQEYAAEKEYRKARIELLNATRLDPENGAAWFALAETQMHLGKAKEAFLAYTRSEGIDPTNDEILLKTAGFHLLMDQVDAADSRVARLLEKHPEDVRVLYLKGQILTRKKAFADAAAVYEAILALDPNHLMAHERLAAVNTFLKKYDVAEQLLLRAVNIDKDALSPRITLFSFYVGQKQYDKARDLLTTAAGQFPDNMDIPLLLGNLHLKTGNIKAAETAYLSTLDIAPESVKPHVALARFYDYTNRPEQALEQYTRALALQPDNDSLKTAVAASHLKNGRTDKAAQMIAPLLVSRPDFFPALLLDSEIKIKNGEHLKALEQLEALEKQRPETAQIYFLKGLALVARSDKRRAVNAMEKAVDRQPGHNGARLTLAGLYYDDNAFERARRHATAVLAQTPDHYQALDILANCDMEDGKKDHALKGFQRLVTLAPENPRGYQLLGLYSAYEQNYAQSNHYLTRALELNPAALDVTRLLVRNHMVKKQFQAAHEQITAGLAQPDATDAFRAALHTLDGDVYRQEKAMDEALASYRKALEFDPDLQTAHFAVARTHMETGDRDKAMAAYQGLLDKNPGLVVPHMMMGMLLDADADHDAAAAHYKKALEINPRYAPAANNLAVHLIKRTDQVDKALTWARVAREVQPEDPAVMDTLGLVYLKKGLADSAVTEFAESLERSKNNPEVMLHLGRAYHEKGDLDKARGMLEKLIALAPAAAPAKQAALLLEQIKE